MRNEKDGRKIHDWTNVMKQKDSSAGMRGRQSPRLGTILLALDTFYRSLCGLDSSVGVADFF